MSGQESLSIAKLKAKFTSVSWWHCAFCSTYKYRLFVHCHNHGLRYLYEVV